MSSHGAKPEVLLIAARAGFRPQHVGGNCWQFALRIPVNGGGMWHLAVTVGGEPIIDGDPEREEWCAGIVYEGPDGSWDYSASLQGEMKLHAALVRAHEMFAERLDPSNCRPTTSVP